MYGYDEFSTKVNNIYVEDFDAGDIESNRDEFKVGHMSGMMTKDLREIRNSEYESIDKNNDYYAEDFYAGDVEDYEELTDMGADIF